MDDVDINDKFIVNTIIHNNCDNYNEVRDCTLVSSVNNSHYISYSFSNMSEEVYTGQMQRKSDRIVQDEPTTLSDSIQLEYVTQEVQNPIISKVAELPPNIRTECRHNIASTCVNTTVVKPTMVTTANNPNIINIQLNYDINQPLDPDSWDGDFRAISLHGSMEYLGSNIKIIKELLSRMEKFILDKSIDGNKANNIKDFEGLGKAAWGFISALYLSQQDSLLVDGTNHSFRNNVKSKFSPQTVKKATKAKEFNISHSLYISTLPPPIPAKSAKEVNKISKYFKKQQPVNQGPKSYVQVSTRHTNSTNIAREILKIKKAFPKLQNKKIEIVQKIINSQDKPKPKINMTTKGPSYKQVIVPMKSKDVNILIKDSSMHIININ